MNFVNQNLKKKKKCGKYLDQGIWSWRELKKIGWSWINHGEIRSCAKQYCTQREMLQKSPAGLLQGVRCRLSLPLRSLSSVLTSACTISYHIPLLSEQTLFLYSLWLLLEREIPTDYHNQLKGSNSSRYMCVERNKREQ